MKFSIASALTGVLLASVSAVSAIELLPHHAPPQMVVISPNTTLMTPRVRRPDVQQDIFDFGSGQSGFSELKRLFERQDSCPTGYGSCPNDIGFCCPIGGRCCGGGKCCGSGRWCYATRCCLLAENGCDNQGCCGKSQQCCKGGSCCDGGNNCVIVNGQLGCCPIGKTCTAPTCEDPGYSPCEGENFCCPTGYLCYRDSAGNPKCRDPNSISSPPVIDTTPTSTSTPTPPPTTEIITSQVVTSVYIPPPEASTVIIQTTQTQLLTIQPTSARASTSTSRSASSQAVQTNSTLASNTKSNVGAIAGGAAAGAVAIIVIVIIIVFILRRNKKVDEPPTNAQPPDPVVPPAAGYYNEPNVPGIPPTPGTGDPFLTPMVQHQNIGASYFVPPHPESPGPTVQTGSGSGPYNASHYSGLPEPQQNDMSGVPMPQPQYDAAHPRPLPMSVTPLQGPGSTNGANVARPWSGYVPPSLPAAAAAPYAGSNNSQPSGWTASTNNNGWTSPQPQPQNQDTYAAPAYATGPGRPPSTVYQPSTVAPYSPPGSPPLPEVYGGMAPSGSSALPAGAAPPATIYPSDNKQSYLPYQ